MGLGYDDDRRATTRAPIYVSISGFGNTVETPYRDWPAYASIVEAMSGIYDYRHPGEPPVTIPVGALGDISSALFGVIGILAALRHRERTGEGQYVDIAMFDAMVAMTDIVTNFWSLGVRPEPDKGARGDLRGLPRVRRLRRRADRARAPVREARRPRRPPGVEGRSALRDARGLGAAPRDRRSGPRSTRGRRQRTKLEAARGAHRGRHRRRAEQPRARRDRRPARRGAAHARRDAAHRRRRPSRCSCPATR